MAKVIRENVPQREVLESYKQSVDQSFNHRKEDGVMLMHIRSTDWRELHLTLEELLSLETEILSRNEEPEQSTRWKRSGQRQLGWEVLDEHLSGDLRSEVGALVETLRSGKHVGHLIIRDKILADHRNEAPYVLEDGLAKALALREFLRAGGETPISAYCASTIYPRYAGESSFSNGEHESEDTTLIESSLVATAEQQPGIGRTAPLRPKEGKQHRLGRYPLGKDLSPEAAALRRKFRALKRRRKQRI